MGVVRLICRLCLKICDIFKAIDGDMKNILGIVLPKINLTAIKEPIICVKCLEQLMKCLDFKTRSFYSYDLVPFISDKDTAKVDLRDVYLSKNEKVTDVPDDQDICGFCMSSVKDCTAITLGIEKRDLILKNMIERCLPELNLSMIRKPVICIPCHGSLEHYFRFVTSCLMVEEKINRYYETLDINSKGQVKLCNVLQFIRDVTTKEVDGDSVDIEVGDQFCEDGNNFDERKIGDAGDTVKLEQVDHNEDVNKVVEMNVEMNDQDFNKEQQFMAKNMLVSAEDGVELSIKTEETCRGKNETRQKEEKLFEMEDQKYLLNENIEIKTDEQDFNRFEGDIVLSQSEVTRKLHRREEGSALAFQRDQSNMYVKHTSTKNQVSEMIMYRCELCSFETKYKVSLKYHLLTHKDPSELTMYKCDACSYQSKYQVSLKYHLLTHKDPSEVTMYKCDSCLYQAKHKTSVKRHMILHKNPSEITMHKCDYCSFQTKFKSYLKKHLLKHKDASEVTMYKCDSCSYQTKLKQVLIRHLILHKNSSQLTMYKCDYCSFQTKHKGDLKNHIVVHKDPSEVTMYKCNQCLYQAKYKSSLKKHLILHKKPSEITLYKCDHCLFETRHKINFKNHLLRHKDPSEVTMYKCDSCLYQTKQKVNLKNHLLKHKDPSEITIYKCHSCLYQTKLKANLQNHLLSHKDPLEVTMYKCDFCSFETKYKVSLKNHLLTHKDPSEVTMYTCDSCLYRTKFKNYLRKHLLVHKNSAEVTVFKCDSCPYQSNNKPNLTRHSLVHKE